MAAKRAAIIELYKNGTRVNEIARLVNIHHQNVTRTISRYKELGTLEDRPRTGRPPVQRVQKAKVLIEAKISRFSKRSQRKLAKQHGISRATGRNMVKEELGSYPYKLRKAIALTDEEKRKRLERCEALLKRFAKNNHRKILFSDESYFQLEEGFNRQNTRIIAVSREEANAAGRLMPKSQFPKTLMVWGGICWNGKTPLVIFNPDEKILSRMIAEYTSASTIVWRPRHSIWPAVTMPDALKFIESIFDETMRSLKIIKKSVPVESIVPGDVVAEDVKAQLYHPPFRASIKDGYAVIAADGAGSRRVIGTSTASKDKCFNVEIHPGECCRINTGAPLPHGADAVVQILEAPKVGQDIRERGSDVALDEVLIDAGTCLQPPDMGLLALSNRSHVDVFDKVDVSVLSTGDELTDHPIRSEDANRAIRDTNRPVLLALLRSVGARVHDMGIAKDTKDELVSAIEKAFEHSCILIVTGGVSMGEKDLLKQVLVDDFHMRIHFGRVLMKPGLPTTFASSTLMTNYASGSYKEPRLVFGLPGNPVSGFVTSHLFVCPMLKKASGMQNYEYNRIRVRLIEDIQLDSRPEYRRACIDHSFGGWQPDVPMAECIAGSQISSRLLSLRSANLLLELPKKSVGNEVIRSGEIVTALVIGPI
ncbi:putative molybdopterin binding domain-containing protein [Ditylenchus destructor]|uniref:Molybdopterin binding domain-containing protein n=1 Tax=Ditylenchus destructor TaxID=166010 RepID=A0AAD4N3H5_9BILA|nr:putative molybdopterin binding domain-containing protein [Ditylenchus destructor]